MLRQSPRGYVVERVESVLYRRMTRMEGTVDSSLYKSIRGLGHDPGLASAFADIFAWDIDFTRQLKRGDGFTILYEQLYREEDGAEVYVRPGRILAAQFRGAVGEHTAVYFEENSGAGSYFRPDGETLEQEFLAAPLKFSRISSRYSSARNHPILKVVRPHHGIDYAARQGSPVWSVAEGEVIFRGRNGGFGNLVKVRHAGGYVSYYAHLSAFGQGLEAGQKVKQKQVIGYVGQTGLATGPHVCFRVTKHGNYVNPATLNHSKPVLRSVADASWSEFEMVRDQLLANLESGRLVDVAAGSPL
ncbi:MAG: M23 family metallopeptidase [bacterium]|nr:M23 family metallopeptidase [bacterium]